MYFMKAPTQKDIEKTSDGFYYLNCDGRHEPSWHKYLYYTKKEIISMWKEEHPKQIDCDLCGDPIDADIHKEELGMCLECSNDYFDHDHNDCSWGCMADLPDTIRNQKNARKETK